MTTMTTMTIISPMNFTIFVDSAIIRFCPKAYRPDAHVHAVTVIIVISRTPKKVYATTQVELTHSLTSSSSSHSYFLSSLPWGCWEDAGSGATVLKWPTKEVFGALPARLPLIPFLYIHPSFNTTAELLRICFCICICIYLYLYLYSICIFFGGLPAYFICISFWGQLYPRQ